MRGMSVSRRGLLGSFFRPLKAGGQKAQKVWTAASGSAALGGMEGVGSSSPWVKTNQVAVIQGRHCLAYQGNYCTVCYERCPVPHAIRLDDAVPVVELDTCTGCGQCRDVCPAPTNAILLVERKPGLGG